MTIPKVVEPSVDDDSFEMPGGSFGANLKAARDRKGWGQDELGRRTGLNPATIYRLEIGDRQPRLPTILALADALGMSGSDLIRDL